jgi:hypothetical protein
MRWGPIAQAKKAVSTNSGISRIYRVGDICDRDAEQRPHERSSAKCQMREVEAYGDCPTLSDGLYHRA